MSEQAQKQSRIKDLINKGREQGYLTYDEVNDHLPDDISDPDQVEDIIQMINDMGIRVYEVAPDADELLMNQAKAAPMKSPLQKPPPHSQPLKPKPAAPQTLCACTCERWAP
jgi:RNA polymerase, sigma 70 subunit, RpoD